MTSLETGWGTSSARIILKHTVRFSGTAMALLDQHCSLLRPRFPLLLYRTTHACAHDNGSEREGSRLRIPRAHIDGRRRRGKKAWHAVSVRSLRLWFACRHRSRDRYDISTCLHRVEKHFPRARFAEGRRFGYAVGLPPPRRREDRCIGTFGPLDQSAQRIVS